MCLLTLAGIPWIVVLINDSDEDSVKRGTTPQVRTKESVALFTVTECGNGATVTELRVPICRGIIKYLYCTGFLRVPHHAPGQTNKCRDYVVMGLHGSKMGLGGPVGRSWS
jgi:hypothetical protein